MTNFYNCYNIDISRLTRDYLKHPLQKKDGFHLSEKPYKNDFFYLYIECNVRREDLSKYFKVGKSTIDHLCSLFNIHKTKKQSHKNSIYTCLVKYGKENVFQVKNIQKKQETTVKIRYGVRNVSMLEDIKQKKLNTVKINKTYTSSKDEEYIYSILLQKFNNIHRQYSTDKYPFPCDFYISALDLYIEYQGSWCHGREPFNPNNTAHIQIVKDWHKRAKQGHPRYLDSIKTWVVRDPLKRKTAKDNKLNWLEFFNLKDFMNWYNNL